jgi:tight adherence protein C
MDLTALARPIVLVIVFLGATLLASGLLSALQARRAVRRRVSDQLEAGGAGTQRSLRAQQSETAWIRLVNLVERQGLSLSDTKDDQLRKRLLAAGYSHQAAPRVFTLLRLILTLGLPALFIAGSYAIGNPPGLLKLYLFGAGTALLGLYLPNLWIAARADRRRQELLNGLPDALDLMLVCVEAGLGLEAAFDRVGREMVHSHPLVAQMLSTVVMELRAGRSREDAMRRMADRAGIDEVRSFATLIIQSGKLGSSVAQTLRIYAAEMREKRRLRAEERAHKLPVLISLPLVGCMLPVMIGVLMLPAAIRVIRQILPVMGG